MSAVLRFSWVALIAAINAVVSLSASADPARLDSGVALYLRNCALCHGVDLKGRDANWQPSSPYVPPLDHGGKAWRLTDMQLEAIVASGSHAAPMRFSNVGMPPFASRLEAGQTAAIIAYLKEQWTQPQRALQADATRLALRPDAAMAELGAQLYAAKCAFCHGDKLEGRTYRIGEPGRERDVAVTPLAHNIFAQAMSDATLRAIILSGESHLPIARSEYRMPDWKLDPDDAQAIVRFLREAWRGGAR